jgi:crotonobetainyl-CoA:carnitine CoA-transferase CaiB-like acyl-CoA transferase
MPDVLEGLKVLDLSQMWATPGAAAYLADFGADVIKVEPLWGDDARRTFTQPPMPNGESRAYLVVNRNKRGLAIDLTKPEGKEVINALADRSDVILHNFRPGVVERLGIDYPTLSARNPGLVYAAVTAYGKQGPFALRRGYDRLFQALSGLMGRRRLPDGSPMGAGVWASDMSAPLAIAYGVLLALLHRERTGRGQQVETSLLHMAIAMQAVDIVRLDDAPKPSGTIRDPAAQAMFGSYRCADDAWLTIVVVSERDWQALCDCLELSHLINDPDFDTSAKRLERSDDLFQLLTGVFETQPRAQWMERFAAHDVPGAPVLSPDEVFDSPQVVANDILVSIEQAPVGNVRYMNVPIQLSETPGSVRSSAPVEIGRDTESILEELGYSPAKVNEIRDAGVIK